MFDYIIRRLLLMIPVFFGSTLLVFYILQSVPDGPFEQAVKQIKMAQMASGEGGAATGGNDNNSMEISEDVLEKLRRQYGLDKPIWKRYLIWLKKQPVMQVYKVQSQQVGKRDGMKGYPVNLRLIGIAYFL